MGENLRPNVPFPCADLEGAAACGSELTRTSSDSSAITADSSKEGSRHSGNERKGQTTEWTDEKHSLYLDSLEASFVTELQHSMYLRGFTQSTISSQEPRTKMRNPSNEFMVRQDGCWQKINFERKQNLLDSAADSHVVLGSPWIRRFTSSGKRRAVRPFYVQEHGVLSQGRTHSKGTSTFSSGFSRGLEQRPVFDLRHQDLVGSTSEVSDQNFVDEDKGEKSNCASMAKRLKTSPADASSSDQVVPLGRFHTADASTTNNVSSEREQQEQCELLSENPENPVCPKSELHYCLKGS